MGTTPRLIGMIAKLEPRDDGALLVATDKRE